MLKNTVLEIIKCSFLRNALIFEFGVYFVSEIALVLEFYWSKKRKDHSHVHEVKLVNQWLVLQQRMNFYL